MALPLDAQLCELTRVVSLDILDKLGGLDSGSKLPKFSSYPDLSGDGANRVKGSASPPRYQSLFSSHTTYDAKWRYDEVAGFDDLYQYVLGNAQYRTFVTPVFSMPSEEIDDDLLRRMERHTIFDLPSEVACRHFVLRGKEVDHDFWLQCYKEMERWWRNDDLRVNVVIPIFGVRIDAEAIGPGVSFLPLPTPLLATGWPSNISSSSDDVEMLLRATNALVIADVSVDVGGVWGLRAGTRLRRSFRAELDLGLESLAVVAGEPFGAGYSIYECIGWSSGYRHDLPAGEEGPELPAGRVVGLSVTQPPQLVKSEQLQQAAKTLGTGKPRLRLASRRLLVGRTRPDQVDRIIDYSIGLEAIAGDTETSETTYKLALRLATLLTFAGKVQNPRVIFRLIKKAYAYRSKVAHGTHNAEKSSMLRLDDGTELTCTSFFQWILTWTLEAITEDPTLVDRVPNDDLLFQVIAESAQSD